MTLRTTWLALAPLFAFSACYSPTLTDGQQACSAAGTCASGFTCAADKKCYKTGETIGCKTTCTGATPKCDTSTFTCVGCLVDGDCPAGDLCKGKTCLAGCSAAHAGCGADAGSCDVDLGVCRGCKDDSECPFANPSCDHDTGTCQPCSPQKDICGAGSYCTSDGKGGFQCASGCKSDTDCTTGSADAGTNVFYCCAHQCSNITSDPVNCGACGVSCNPDGGGTGMLCCAAKCTNPQSDTNNCGACGSACAPKNATGTCASASCGVASCSTGFLDCNHIAMDGCEVNSVTDTMNCGACSNICPTPMNAMPGCTMGTCGIGMCNTGFVDCDKTLSNGCETNVTTDVKNCGGCGNVCAVSGGSAKCSAGKCAVGSCSGTLKDCNMSAADGCEADTSRDVNNCGGCGIVCKLGANEATAACVAGVCQVATCAAGFADCNAKATDGCETNIATDISNCGACAAACGTPTNVATPSCTSGKCGVSKCSAGFADCDKSFSDGCEVNLQNDAGNCNACGNACPSGGSCASGTCCPAGSVLVGGRCQITYYVTQNGQFVNMGSCCGTTCYNSCNSQPFGFNWVDTGSSPVSAVTIVVNESTSCVTNPNEPVTFNTQNAGTINWSSNQCSCPASPIQTSYNMPAAQLSAYVNGGTNTFLISSAQCSGLTNGPVPGGMNAYAAITVTH